MVLAIAAAARDLVDVPVVSDSDIFVVIIVRLSSSVTLCATVTLWCMVITQGTESLLGLVSKTVTCCDNPNVTFFS